MRTAWVVGRERVRTVEPAWVVMEAEVTMSWVMVSRSHRSADFSSLTWKMLMLSGVRLKSTQNCLYLLSGGLNICCFSTW